MAVGDDECARGAGEPDGGYKLYRELAGWWPVISPQAEYAEDAATIGAIFDSAQRPVRTILDLGCGGGHLAAYFAAGRSMTLIDLSAEMLAVSRQLNPGCRHVQGDMRTIRLGRQFDAVLVHDAVDYVTTQADLAAVITTAFDHCRPGGVAIFAPDHTAETFRAGTGGGGGHDATGRRASFRERTTDPVRGDDWVLAEYEFTLREADGSVQVVTEAHRLGSFRADTWLTLLRSAGFGAEARTAGRAGHNSAKVVFIGRRGL